MKIALAKLTGRNRGPRAVVESLVRGLKELGVPYKINPKYSTLKKDDVVYVVSGIQALKDLILFKQKNSFKKLLAGPSITILPTEEQDLLKNKNIDAIIVPSQWVKDLYESLDQNLSTKIHILPAGVEDCFFPKKDNNIVLYIKNAPETLTKKVQSVLEQDNIPYSSLSYGSFKRENFFNQLKSSSAMIYLSPTESQGLALHEAWIRDIPTLVWSRGYWQYKDIIWKDPKISAPYLSEKTGLFFKDEDDFESKFKEFLEKIKLNQFEPRTHSLQYFTDKKCVEKLLWIINAI